MLTTAIAAVASATATASNQIAPHAVSAPLFGDQARQTEGGEERECGRERETERQGDREKSRETERQRNRETERERDRETEQRDRETERPKKGEHPRLSLLTFQNLNSISVFERMSSFGILFG